MAQYVTPAEFLKRFDHRTVGDLVADDDNQVPYVQLLTNANLSVCIDDASGDIDSALVVGDRYTTDDLETLTGNALAHLRRICSDLTMFYLLDRRPSLDAEKLEAYEKLRSRHIERLRKGENVFNLAANRDAGNPSIDGPTTTDFDRLNLVRDRVNNYYPRRVLPSNR